MMRYLVLCTIVGFAACQGGNRDSSSATVGKPGKLPGKLPENVEQLYRLTTSFPDSASLRMQLVEALDSLGQTKPALAQMDSLIRRDSLNYGFWYRKALLQQNDKDTVGALRSYRYAIRVYPAPDALLAAANLLAEKKDPAALLLTRQVEQQRLGREYEAHTSFISGVYYARTGQNKKALEAFNACIYNDLHYMEAYMEKGFIYYDSRAYKEALQVFQTAAQIKSTYADAIYWLAKTQETMGDKASATVNYQRAQTLDPTIKEAAQALHRLK